jgi:cathepsin D
MFGMKCACLFAALFATALPQGAADLAAAVWRSSHRASAAPPVETSLTDSFVVRLERVQAPVEGSFYMASVNVGQPAQQLNFMFDTSSGQVLLPHRACKSPACLNHKRYSPWESRTAQDVNADGRPVQKGFRLAKGKVNRSLMTVEFTQADLGTGAAKGVMVRDRICLGEGSPVCADVSALAAISLDDAPFKAMPNDGIIGLGLEALSASSSCSFFEQLASTHKNMLPHFGIYFGEAGGEIHFGSHDRARIAEPLQWFPVLRPEEGFWQVEIKSIRVGNANFSACGDGCRAIIDTGASRLGVQARMLPQLKSALTSAPTATGACDGPDLQFDLGGMVVVVRAADYAAGSDCAPHLGALDLDGPDFNGVFAFGEDVLRRYYAAFDWGDRRVGFARTMRLGRLGQARADSKSDVLIV